MTRRSPINMETGDGRRPSVRTRRLRVVVGAALFVLLAGGVYVASPWLLPLSIVEGPMVQQPTGGSARVVWYLSRPDESLFRLIDAPESARVAETHHDGRRWSVLITGLTPGAEYAYRVLDGVRELAAHKFLTAKPVDQPFNFIVFGDSGKGTKQQFLLAAEMEELEPDFLVHTGDIVYPDGSRYRYRGRFFDPYRELLPSAAIWPCLGNHDVSKPGYGAAYYEVFELPENGPANRPAEENYWFDFGGARFVMFNSNLAEPHLSESIAPWLADVLDDEGPLWRFVVFHHPPYTAGSHDPDTDIQRAIVPVLEAGRVDVVFNGHDHMYQRTLPMLAGEAVVGDEDAASTNGQSRDSEQAGLAAPEIERSAPRGVVYVVSGAGGARLYDAMPESQRPKYFASVHNEVHSFTHVHIDGPKLLLQQIDLKGAVLDEWSLTRPGSRPPF